MADPLHCYVHIPFCRRKCPYCGFVSYAGKEYLLESYGRAVAAEAQRVACSLPGRELDTVYFGGGTPSLLAAEQVGHLLAVLDDVWGLASNAEVTLEANPGTVDGEKLAALRRAGANRLSLGVQSFDDGELALLGRLHSAGEALAAYGFARQAGFGNICLDLIWGLPEQTAASWRLRLRKAIELGPEHVSAYALTLEEGTQFGARAAAGELALPDEDTQLAMYETARRMLAEAGYGQYEISNWARPGYECRHNLAYWHGQEYVGLGAGAHSFVQGTRRANVEEVEAYIEAVERGQAPTASEESLSPQRAMGEAIMLGLRTVEGVDLAAAQRRFGVDPWAEYADAMQQLEGLALLARTDRGIRLTERGMALADEIAMRFL